MDDQANVVGALRSDRKSLAPRRSGAVTGRCGRLIRCEAKRMKEGRRGAWSGVPPPASASDDAKERGPQLPPSLAHPEPRPNSAVRVVINFGLAHPATTI